MQRCKDQFTGAGASQLWKLSGRLGNLPQVIHMSDSKQKFNIPCPLFRVNASEIDYSRKRHPCEIGCENKISKSEENIKETSQGESHHKSTKSTGNAFTTAMSVPEAWTL